MSLFGPILSEKFDPGPILENQSLLLSTGPALQLPFRGDRLSPGGKLLRENETHRAPFLRVSRNLIGMVL